MPLPQPYRPQSAQSTPATREDIERNVLLVTYVLYGLGFFFVVTAIAGVVVNHIKLRENIDRISWSHHRWLMRTFWFALLWSIICLVLVPVVIGLVGYAILWLWCLYRVVRGVCAFADRHALPAPGE